MKLGERAVVKDRSITILVEFVPLTFDTEKTEDIVIAENDSKLPVGSIISARWIKPENRRKEGQKVAHLIIKVSGAEAANQILRDGMVIRSKRVRGRKIAREPRIDTTCISAKCTSAQEVCGTCSENHRTKECKEMNPAKFKCANCNIHGHASWGRECLTYQRSALKLRQRDTEATYRYIPTDEPWTWEQEWNNNSQPQPSFDNNGNPLTGHQGEGWQIHTNWKRTLTQQNITGYLLRQNININSEPHSPGRVNGGAPTQ
ncbi:hypothetical protein M422DRAFT_175624 [Sphaerobolus stellatus SS14]|uniref:Uncharacterized protein n=1 Tax=Sphaerobolus stellatus (strain SS14) TaxID=990650 RepID=A0A0C9VN55_SPHS4|nr:hypothetical protein M422DRAFT_175624 [Sphaerobolus stellatus SS14]